MAVWALVAASRILQITKLLLRATEGQEEAYPQELVALDNLA